MTDSLPLPDVDELERLGLYDPHSPDAAERLEMIRYVMARGATLEAVELASSNLGELALDMALRPRGPVSLAETAATVGIDWATAQRLLTAVGLPTDPDVLITADEATALRVLATANDHLLGEEATLQLARVAGNAMARVAETLVGAFRLRVELPHRDAGTPYVDVVSQYTGLARNLLPAFVTTLDAILRRQMVAVAERMWSTDEERSAVTLERTVGFVDLVGYTSTTTSLSVRELTAVLIEFDARTAEVVARGHGQIIKMIGDEAMFVTEDANDACRIALALTEGIGGRLSAVRVGLASGEMVSVFGDLYGPDVNLAARLVTAADPATALASSSVRARADEFEFEALPPLDLKGFPDPVQTYRIKAR